MRKILFFSRHVPTLAQTTAFNNAGYDILPMDVDFNTPFDGVDAVAAAITAAINNGDIVSPDVVAGVFPLQTIAALKAAKVTVISTVTTVRGLRVDQAMPDQLRLISI